MTVAKPPGVRREGPYAGPAKKIRQARRNGEEKGAPRSTRIQRIKKLTMRAIRATTRQGLCKARRLFITKTRKGENAKICRIWTAFFVFSSFRAFVTKSFAVGGGLGELPGREPALRDSWSKLIGVANDGW